MAQPMSFERCGFTLIEVMITVAIVAILAAVALPSYRDYVIRSRIPQATANLASMRVKLEQYYQDNRTYVGGCASLPPDDDFKYSCPTLAVNAFTVAATGKGAMTGFTYTIDEANKKTTAMAPSGWGSAPINCWVIGKGGQC